LSPGGKAVSITVQALDEELLKFTVVAQHVGMVAVGFPRNEHRMLDADAVISWIDSAGVASISDYYIGNTRSSICVQPAADKKGICLDSEIGGSSNLIDASIAIEGTTTTVIFTRKRNTGDLNDVPLAAPGLPQAINVALGGSNSLSYHSEFKTWTSIIMPEYWRAPPTSAGFTLNAADSVFPTVVPSGLKGAFVSLISYTASEPVQISVTLFNTAWAYFGGGSTYVLAGNGRARVFVPITTAITGPVYAQVKMTTLTSTTAIASFNSPTFTPDATITNTFALATPSVRNKLTIVSIPTTIPSKGLFFVKVTYEAMQTSFVSLNLQQNGGAATWFAGATFPVPAGTGTVQVGIKYEIPSTTNLTTAVIGVNAYMYTEATYRGTVAAWTLTLPGTNYWVIFQSVYAGEAVITTGTYPVVNTGRERLFTNVIKRDTLVVPAVIPQKGSFSLSFNYVAVDNLVAHIVVQTSAGSWKADAFALLETGTKTANVRVYVGNAVTTATAKIYIEYQTLDTYIAGGGYLESFTVSTATSATITNTHPAVVTPGSANTVSFVRAPTSAPVNGALEFSVRYEATLNSYLLISLESAGFSTAWKWVAVPAGSATITESMLFKGLGSSAVLSVTLREESSFLANQWLWQATPIKVSATIAVGSGPKLAFATEGESVDETEVGQQPTNSVSTVLSGDNVAPSSTIPAWAGVVFGFLSIGLVLLVLTVVILLRKQPGMERV